MKKIIAIMLIAVIVLGTTCTAFAGSKRRSVGNTQARGVNVFAYSENNITITQVATTTTGNVYVIGNASYTSIGGNSSSTSSKGDSNNNNRVRVTNSGNAMAYSGDANVKNVINSNVSID
jgi:hypothetical protein